MRYCIGDIHGCAKTLINLTEKIRKKDHAAEFYFVGDLIDRGPDSKSVIDYVMGLNKTHKNMNCVPGNHEIMMLEAYKNNLTLAQSNWQYNGGETTLRSLDPEANLNLKINELIPEKYYSYINSLPFYIELEDYFIVHAGFNFNAESPFKDYDSMIWTREELNNNEITKGKKIIHGHTPIPLKEVRSRLKKPAANNINIDTGCVYNNRKNLGILTALNLDNLELIGTENIDMP